MESAYIRRHERYTGAMNRGLNWRRTTMRLVRVSVTAVAVMWVIDRVDPGRLSTVLTRVPLWVFGVPAFAVALNTAIQAHRLRLLLGGLGAPLPLSRLMGLICRGAFAGLALPQGGAEVVKAA